MIHIPIAVLAAVMFFVVLAALNIIERHPDYRRGSFYYSAGITFLAGTLTGLFTGKAEVTLSWMIGALAAMLITAAAAGLYHFARTPVR